MAAATAVVGLMAATIHLGLAQSAEAAVVVNEDAMALGQAMSNGASVTAARLKYDYDCTTECPTGTGNSAAAGFPAAGADYAMLTTGDAALSDDANDDGGTGIAWSQDVPEIGADVYDAQVLELDLGPATGSCLAFDFRFLSEEYPEYVLEGYNDAFVAQLNSWNVHTDPTTKSVSAPGDFAAGAGDQISVDAAGPSSMDLAQAAGTTYDGATLKLVARKPVVPGSTNTLYLTIFDQGDAILDSAVFLDNLRYENLPAGQCKSLALDPFEGRTGLVAVPGTTTKLNKAKTSIFQQVSCALPPGPIGCNVQAQMVFSGVTRFGGVSARAAASQTVMGTTNLSIPAGSSATARVNASGPGAKIITKAKAFPKKLKKKAAVMEKRARKAGLGTAKGKKLMKQATQLRKQAAQLSKQKVLGYITLKITNPANGAVESSKRFKVLR